MSRRRNSELDDLRQEREAKELAFSNSPFKTIHTAPGEHGQEVQEVMIQWSLGRKPVTHSLSTSQELLANEVRVKAPEAVPWIGMFLDRLFFDGVSHVPIMVDLLLEISMTTAFASLT
jgi:hypothetical protein